MKQISKLISALALLFGVVTMGNSQCATWNDSPQKDDAENAHSIYRQAMKSNDFALAFENWEKAFSIAPAADGKRDYHFTDGAKLYLEKFKTETDATKKEEYKQMYIKLIDDAIACYDAGTISSSKCPDGSCIPARVGYLQGRRAFDMYYTLNTPYSQTMAALEDAVAKGGNSTEYIVFDPYGKIAAYQFTKGKIDKAQARAIHKTMNEIADHNIANNSKLGTYYEQSKKIFNSHFREIEGDIFDCDYFVNKLKPEYEANPEDPENWKRIVSKLKKQGCEDGEPFLAEVETKYQKWAAETNAARQAEFEANNPAILAKKAYDAGDFEGAVAKYDIAIEGEEDPSKKAGYMFSKASIEGRKLKKYSNARRTALAAAKMRPNWGRPYMLIGDLYGSSARSCGDSWNQRLAILAAMDKYRYARSVDPSVSDEASTRLSKYAGSMPSLEDGFQRGIKEGETVKVGCWIGESVKVKYRK